GCASDTLSPQAGRGTLSGTTATPSPRKRGEGWGKGPKRSALQQRALLAFEHLPGGRALHQAVLEAGVVLQILDRQADPPAPAVEDQAVRVAGGVLRTH